MTRRTGRRRRRAGPASPRATSPGTSAAGRRTRSRTVLALRPVADGVVTFTGGSGERPSTAPPPAAAAGAPAERLDPRGARRLGLRRTGSSASFRRGSAAAGTRRSQTTPDDDGERDQRPDRRPAAHRQERDHRDQRRRTGHDHPWLPEQPQPGRERGDVDHQDRGRGERDQPALVATDQCQHAEVDRVAGPGRPAAPRSARRCGRTPGPVAGSPHRPGTSRTAAGTRPAPRRSS